MGLFFENIPRPLKQGFRVLRWQGHSSELTLLTANPSTTVCGPGARWHIHPELEFTIVTAGKGVRYVGDHVGPFAAPDCVLLGSGLPHCWVEKGEYSGYMLQFLFSPEHGVWRLGCETELYTLFKVAHRGLIYSKRIATEALPLLERFGPAGPLVRTSLLLELFTLLYGAMQREATPMSSSTYGGMLHSAVTPKLEDFIKWLLEHFHEPISLEDACSRSAMSRATFSRQFKRYTGKTFVAFLNDVRLLNAYHQLVSSRRSVLEIAFGSGFNSLSHFGALFRTHYHTSPRQCRNVNGESEVTLKRVGVTPEWPRALSRYTFAKPSVLPDVVY